MAKTRPSGSAAQRRVQERTQRQRRDEVRVSALHKGKNINRGKGPTIRRKDRSGLYMIIGVLALIVVIVVAFVIISRQSTAVPKATAADPTVVGLLTGVSPSTISTIGTGGVTQPFIPPIGGHQPPLTANGHPEFFYVGAEWCPNCAAERWAMINALSRFGTFSHLSQIQSAEGNISTFTFEGSSYSSQYITFVVKEIQGNSLNHPAQDTLTPAQQQLFTQYGSGFPFVDIGGNYVFNSATYSPQVLLDGSSNPLTAQDIASSLSNPQSPIAKSIIGSANYMTAAICNLTNQQPGNVCSVPAIQQIEQSLPKTANTLNGNSLALAPALTRRVLG